MSENLVRILNFFQDVRVENSSETQKEHNFSEDSGLKILKIIVGGIQKMCVFRRLRLVWVEIRTLSSETVLEDNSKIGRFRLKTCQKILTEN